MTEHENECKPLGWRLLSKMPHSTIIALIFSLSGHSENPPGAVNGHEIQATSEELVLWLLWCRGFVWKAEFDVSSLDGSCHIAY